MNRDITVWLGLLLAFIATIGGIAAPEVRCLLGLQSETCLGEKNKAPPLPSSPPKPTAMVVVPTPAPVTPPSPPVSTTPVTPVPLPPPPVPKMRLSMSSEDSADSADAPPTELLPAIQITEQEAARSGQLIWMNESSGKTSGLMTWNKGENWASLGIGHFIWYPQGQKGPFTETFPDLVEFLQEHGVAIPEWLQNTPHCPWNSRQEFLDDGNSPEKKSLQTLMEKTISQQVLFLVRRWQQALPKILGTLFNQSQRNHVRTQFYRVAQAPTGVYVLIDYINFKGEGTSPKERYQGQGWGLLQVLEEMSGDSPEDATKEFAIAAETVLNRRVQNAPAEKNEARFLKGWKKRLDTYR
jgi:hypothetical protein